MKQIFGFALSCLVIVGVNSLQAQTENASKGAGISPCKKRFGL